ncbi:hypothetical protein MBLNU230_g2885t1 [Neophaeotheca triangularis]
MRPIARQSARLAHRQQLRSASRTRSPRVPQSRGISSSAPKLSEPRPPNGSPEDHSHLDRRREEQKRVTAEGSRPEQAEDQDAAETKAQTDNRRPGLRKTLRQRRQSDVPKPPPLPEWFLKHNVELRIEGQASGASPQTHRSIHYVDKKTGHTLFTVPYLPAPESSFEPSPSREEHHTSLGESNPPANATAVPSQRKAPEGPSEATKSDQIGQNFFGYRFGSESAEAKEEEAALTNEQPSQVKSAQSQKHPEVTPEPESKGQLPERWEKEESSGEQKREKTKQRHPINIEHAWSVLEMEAVARAAMNLSQGGTPASNFAVSRVDLSLHCPDANTHKDIDMLVRFLAIIIHADVVRLDVNDFADLTSDYVGQSHDSPGSFSTLGYDVYDGYQANKAGGSMKPPAPDPDNQDPDFDDPEEEPDLSKPDVHGFSLGTFANTDELRKMLYDRRHELGQALKGIGIPTGTPSVVTTASAAPPNAQQQPAKKSSTSPGDYVQWDDTKLGALLDTLVDAGKNKRTANPVQQALRRDSELPLSHWRSFVSSLLQETLYDTVKDWEGTQIDIVKEHSGAAFEGQLKAESKQRTIIHVRDLKDIRNSRLGDAIVRRLVRVVQKRRRNGEEVMIVGTSAQEPIGPPDTLIDEAEDSPFRSMVVHPELMDIFVTSLPPRTQKLFEFVPDDLPSGGGYPRIFEINARHIDSMLRRLAPGSNMMLSKDSSARKIVGRSGLGFLKETVLSLDDVQRLVLIAVGLAQTYVVTDKVEPYHIGLARIAMTRSDRFLREWQPINIAPSLDAVLGKEAKSDAGNEKPQSGKARIEELKKSCNTHETKLLSGVKDADSISTAFSDVHAAKETIDSLKTLTSLSLLRPDAFKYGVLARDRLPGLLLYGPPGTGKTLLAKAVAKESRATVLEVSGAQIYEKYVGEGEKMVNAVFTLAKKLSPCVVFIDEADALFGARSSSGTRNTHREIINQFLRGWDGMDDHGVFMMVATNRPFDLDDAVLRRLPRRLLVDLPMAKDRQSILGIHLQSEALAPSVDLAALSEQTPFYSGSDLKNLCVSAALAAVREENEVADANKGDPAFKLPSTRTLEARHFDKAMAEVSASISEDMSSLKAIRKFDEQYGDRRERRKKSTYGFGLAPESGVPDESAARVRQGTTTTTTTTTTPPPPPPSSP